MKYLVTGGSGYLGSHLVDQLISENHEVVVFDDLSGKVATNFTEPVSMVTGDITLFSEFQKLDGLGPFDGVFHLAAKKSVTESVAKPHLYRKVNEIGSLNVIEYCVNQGINKIVLTSSAAVYGAADLSFPIDEKLSPNPINPYGLSKLSAENILTRFCNENDLSAVSLRTFNIVGASKPNYLDSVGENVLPVIARMLKQNEIFKIFGDAYETKDGTCVRDYVNVAEVASAHILAMEYLQDTGTSISHEIINISSGVGISILELVNKMEFYSAKQLKWVYGESRAGDPASVIGSNSLAKRLIGWNPDIGLDQSIRETLGQF